MNADPSSPPRVDCFLKKRKRNVAKCYEKNVNTSLYPKQSKYDKSSFCKFCKHELKSKLSRHLLTVHRDIPEISQILLLPKKSKERLQRLARLANDGNFLHNATAIKESANIVVGKKSSSRRASDYLPCEWCHKYLLKSSLWKHRAKCICRPRFSNEKEKCESSVKRYGYAVSNSRYLMHSSIVNEENEDDNDKLVDLYQRMSDGITKDIVMQDRVIKRYAVLRIESLGQKTDQKLNDIHRVSQGARTLARLVEQCRTKKPGVTLYDLIRPENFDIVVQAAQTLSATAVSLGRLIGCTLCHAVNIKASLAVRMDDDEEGKKTDAFKKLFSSEWNYRVNAPAVKKMNTIKRSRIQTIPLTEDLKVLRNFIIQETKSACERLRKAVLPSDWTWLAKLTMSRLIIFNKRRRAEVKDLKVSEFITRPKWNEHSCEEMKLSLSTTDRIVAER